MLLPGPCGGKSSSLEYLLKELKSFPAFETFEVYTVPESATLIGNCGLVYPGLSEERRAELTHFELELMKLQLCLEDTIVNIAKFSKKNCIIICDRGTIDLKPYMPEESWMQIVEELSLNESELFRRYQFVLHLHSVAVGAESYYSNDSNAVRTETVEEAKFLDKVTYDFWSPHPNLKAVDNNCENFAAKLKNVRDCVIAEAMSYFRLN